MEANVTEEMYLTSEVMSPQQTTQIIGRLASMLRNSALSRTQICQQSAVAASKLFHGGSCEVWLLEDHSPRIKLVASSGLGFELAELADTLPLNRRSIQGRTVLYRDAVFIANSSCLPATDQQRLRLAKAQRVATLPLVVNGQVFGVLCVMHTRPHAWSQHDRVQLCLLADLTALALHNALLAEREEALQHYEENMVAAVSHELRTPLTSILGYLSLFQRRLGSNMELHKAEHYLRVAMQQAQALSAILDELLDVGLIQHNQLTLHLESVVPEAVFNEVLDEARKRYPERVISVNTIHPPQQEGTWDTVRVRQILRHIIKNAIIYSPSHTTVDVTLDYTPSDVRIAVRDQGSGIQPAHHQRIFKRFWRGVDNSFHKSIYGLGVGLYLGQALAAAHGGELTVESSGVSGQGSTFTLILPWQSPTLTALVKSALG